MTVSTETDASPTHPSGHENTSFHQEWSDRRLPAEVMEILKISIGKGYNATTIPAVQTVLQMGLVRELDAEGRPVARTGSPVALSPAPSPRLNGPTAKGPSIRVLDVACGYGAPALVVSLLASMDMLSIAGEVEIIAADSNSEKLATLNDVIKHNNFRNIVCEPWAMESLGAPTNYFSHVCVNFSAHWAVDEGAMLKEILRTLRHGGVVGFATWMRSGWRVRSKQDLLKILPSGGWEDPVRIKRVLTQRGFVDIESNVHVHSPQVMPGHMQNFIPQLVENAVRRLWNNDNNVTDEETRQTMKQSLIDMYVDGYFDGTMTAIITTARKPSQKIV